MKKLVMFGSGYKAEKIVPLIKDKSRIKYFLDNDSKKWGSGVRIDGCDFQVFSPDHVLSENIDDITIIISSTYKQQMLDQLIELYKCRQLRPQVYEIHNDEELIAYAVSFTSTKQSDKLELGFELDIFSNSKAVYFNFHFNVIEVCIENVSCIDFNGNIVSAPLNDIITHHGTWISENKFTLLAMNSSIRISNTCNVKSIRMDLSLVHSEAKTQIFNHLNNILNSPNQREADYVNYEEDYKITLTDDDVKPIAFYLPQFYTFPENDLWWGRGFTEWTNVTKILPYFEGHYQPHLPIDLGFYDLNNIEVQKRQVELAKKYGIYGFCFYYYRFGEKRLLDMPLENYANNKESLDFPFCILWANENWTKRWDGYEQEVLVKQEFSEQEYLLCIKDIARYMKDSRYIKVDGKPLVIVYKTSQVPDADIVAQVWRDYCKKVGIGEICLLYSLTPNYKIGVSGYDGAVEFPPHFIFPRRYRHNYELDMYVDDFKGYIYDYKDLVENEKYYTDEDDKNLLKYKTAFPYWDNCARRNKFASIYHNSSAALFQKWLEDIMAQSKQNQKPADRYVFINAWNEWAEGAHLEPDRKRGYANLKAVANAIMKTREDTRKL